MPSQCQSKTPQPTPGHVHDYSHVTDEELVILTDDSTDTEREKSMEKVNWRGVQRQHRPEGPWGLCGGHCHQAAPLHSLCSEPDHRAVRARTRQDQGLCALSQEEKGKGKERATEMEEADDEWEAGREADEPATPLEGPSGVRVHTQWVEWEQEWQLQAMERQAKAHETAALAFKRMAEAAEQMAVAAEQTADEWALYHAWAEWVEMRRREDVQEARMAELECTGGGWKRPESEAVEKQQEEADEGVEGDNEEEGEVGGEQDGGEEQEGGRETAMEE
ncbi:hypothetical protein M404DRAFT_18727 [Pisolithus tinctorius Marx 270]|uniref:Uncharacterized protein n=1 Tax=Pisolithus tinctorius Marx 270 TaxID=870435 RepID=A0A0C3KUD7_PISTI|nr:hypothetical protein M404DRAFT_18727 [Pisolithus tinctorius Marx 270]